MTQKPTIRCAIYTRKSTDEASTLSSGHLRGGLPFCRGPLHRLLTNPVYMGRIRHKDQTFPGQHAAIIDDVLWDNAQTKLIAASARPRGQSATHTDPRILTAKLRDETGDLLTPTHAQRFGKRSAYHVSNRLIARGRDPTGWRLPAEALEAALRRITVAQLRKAAKRYDLVSAPDAGAAAELIRRANQPCRPDRSRVLPPRQDHHIRLFGAEHDPTAA